MSIHAHSREDARAGRWIEGARCERCPDPVTVRVVTVDPETLEETVMSYPRNLDEIPAEELRAELHRRWELKEQALCDYCERPKSAPTCKFPDRHAATPSRPAKKRSAPWAPK